MSEADQSYEELRKKAAKQRASGENLAAAKSFLLAAELRPTSNAAMFAGLAFRDAEEFERAKTVLEEYAKSHPADQDGWITLGTLFKQRGMFEEALEPYRTALSIRDHITCRNAYISSLWRTGALDEAQLEGLKNLKQKHAQSLEVFSKSPYSDYSLREGGRGFDPDRRARNIIAFSLWGDRPEYVTGAIINAQIAKHLYVNWTPRFYCDTSVPADAREALEAYDAQVVLMTRPEHAKIRPMWRFLAAGDPDVNVFVCRDTDSRLNAKELLAVHDWLGSGKRFHVMRDHHYHHELILAGMWGGTSGVLPNMADWLMGASSYFDNRFGDQAFLADCVWPMIWRDCKIHDTYYRFPDGDLFPSGYELPGKIHVGGGVKTMPHWSKYVQMPPPT